MSPLFPVLFCIFVTTLWSLFFIQCHCSIYADLDDVIHLSLESTSWFSPISSLVNFVLMHLFWDTMLMDSFSLNLFYSVTSINIRLQLFYLNFKFATNMFIFSFLFVSCLGHNSLVLFWFLVESLPVTLRKHLPHYCTYFPILFSPFQHNLRCWCIFWLFSFHI